MVVGACERGESFSPRCSDLSTTCTSNMHTFSRHTLAVSAEATGQACTDGTWKISTPWIRDSTLQLQGSGVGEWVTEPQPLHQPLQGSQAFRISGEGTFQHQFTGPFSIPAGATDLIAHVFLANSDPAAEVMVQLYINSAWKRAYYGGSHTGLSPATNMGNGVIPTPGAWRQLCVPLGLLQINTDADATVDLINLTAYSASQTTVTWDYVGIGTCGLDYSCSCALGWVSGSMQCTGSLVTCDDFNECNATHYNATTNHSINLCDAASSYCNNTAGSFECSCNAGYQNDDPAENRACSDVDECLMGAHNCNANGGVCTNTVGSFTCACSREGISYTGDGLDCAAVGACELGNHNCHSNATCTSHLPSGNFSCACNAGYLGNGTRCENFDECEDASRNNCDQNADCTDTDGSFLCACRNWAYTGDGTNGTCQLTGACELNLDDCASNATCTSTETGFNCTCDEGFVGNGTICLDIDECARNQSNCDPRLGRCTNTLGSFTCECDPSILGKDAIAYIDSNGDGTNCQDRNECAGGRNEAGGNNCDPNALCTNTDGSFTCACNVWDYTAVGFAGGNDRVAAAGDGTSCEATGACVQNRDTCAGNVSVCNSTGYITPFECLCAVGYVRPDSVLQGLVEANANGTDCGDFDECFACTDDCAEEADCTNTEGSFTCACAQGYVGNGTFCVDVCTSGDNDCHENATCLLNPDDGTYTCTCKSSPGEYRFFGDGWKDTVGLKWQDVGMTDYNLARACGADGQQPCLTRQSSDPFNETARIVDGSYLNSGAM